MPRKRMVHRSRNAAILGVLLCALSVGCGDSSDGGGDDVSAGDDAAPTDDGAGGRSSTPDTDDSMDTGGSGATSTNSSKPDIDPTTPTNTTALCDGEASVTLYDDTNYAFSNELILAHGVVKDATDLTFDWSGVTRDMFGKEVDPATDLGSVLISLWPLTPEEIAEALRTDSLSSSLAKGAITAYPDGSFTSENLLDFTVFGEDLPEQEVWNWFDTSTPDYQFPQDSHTFLFSVSGGTNAATDQRMLRTFSLDPASTETSVVLDSNSTTVDFELDLMSPVAVSIPVGNADVELSWRGITKTALGNDYIDTSVSEVVVAQYDMTRDELEENFLQLRDLSVAQWGSDDIAGRGVELTDLSNDAGEPFAGITTEGLWLAAMFCTVSCNNPAPVSITFLEPCE